MAIVDYRPPLPLAGYVRVTSARPLGVRGTPLTRGAALFVDSPAITGPPLAGYVRVTPARPRPTFGLARVDHVVGNVADMAQASDGVAG